MNNPNQRKVRAVSARIPQGRPGSGKNKKIHQKTQFIENVYSNPTSNFHSFHKNKIFSMRSNMPEADQEDVSKLMPRGQKINKDREELFEQNLHLKQQINKLKDQLTKSKTKIQNLTSKNQKYTKQFNRQFQKKMYWNGTNSYMISGIKAQYQKLKEQYSEKQSECNILRKQLTQSGVPQLKVYCETLQQQNLKLTDRIKRMSQISEQILLDNTGDKIVPEYLYHELKKKKQRADQKIYETQYKLKVSKEEVREQRKKIQFLQKLIIQKDNSQYHASKKAKKSQRQKNQLLGIKNNLENQIQEVSRAWEQRLEKLKFTENRKFQSEKSMFDRTLSQKDQKIRSLEKEVAYLSTLLTYWKPLDELNKQMGNNRMEESKHSLHQEYEHPQQNNLDQLGVNLMNPSVISRKRKPSQTHSIKGGDMFLNLSKQLEAVNQENKVQRIQQTADLRHSQEAQKKRKVDIKQIEHLGEHLRYRLIGLKMQLKEARQFFQFKGDKQQFILSNQQELQWQKQYINMKQAKQILMRTPFQLPEQDAHILSRYLIQDSDKQYVYCDLKNENKRSIIKSIFRSLVGNYEILDQQKQQKVQKQCEVMLERYSTNLLSALSTMASSGFVSRKKFNELVNSLGIELSQQGRDYLVCKMLLKSESLNALDYMILF